MFWRQVAAKVRSSPAFAQFVESEGYFDTLEFYLDDEEDLSPASGGGGTGRRGGRGGQEGGGGGHENADDEREDL